MYTDFNGWFNRIHSPGEVNSGVRILEPGESLPRRVLIERMQQQGVADAVARAMQRLYMFGADERIPDGFIGPLGHYSTDILDIGALKEWLTVTIKGQKEEADRLAAIALEKKNATSQTGSGDTEAAASGGDNAGGSQ